MRADAIVGYTYNGDTYCPDHILARLIGSKLSDTIQATAEIRDPEADLDLLAGLAGVDRNNEHTFDSGDFPKVMFASQVKSDVDRCGVCQEPLVPAPKGDTSAEVKRLLEDWISTSLDLIDNTSTTIAHDCARFIDEAKECATTVGIPWSDDLVPSPWRTYISRGTHRERHSDAGN